MTDDLEIRAADDGELDAIVELMRESLGEGRIPRTREFFRWKHLDNPFGRSPMLVALDGERLVGLRVFLRWAFHWEGRTVRAVRPVDTVTHPAYRGRGIFRRLTEELLARTRDDDAPIVFNTPNDKSRPGYLKMGWGLVGRVPLWVAPRPRLVGSILSGRSGATDVEEPPRGSVKEVVAGLDEALLRNDRERRRGRLHTVRSRDYLTWRYARPPGLRYGARAEEHAALFYALRSRSGRRELTLVDVLMESSPRGARAARSLARQLLAEVEVDYAAVSPACRWESVALLSAGFVPAFRIGPWLTARSNGAGAPAELMDPGRWACSIGDLELF